MNTTYNTTNSISVVVPVFNESAVYSELYRRLTEAVDRIGADYEIVFVDDGSTDDTLAQIRSSCTTHPKVRYISFSRNFGHQAAVSAGIEAATNDAVIVMDGDLQDPPEIIPELLKKRDEGWDVVYAVRRNRKEHLLIRLCYFLFYRVLQRIADIQIPADSGDFCVMDRRVVDVLKRMPERNRYVRGIRAWVGFRQTALPYERDKRYAGEPKYSVAKYIRLAVDGISSFSQFPLRLCGYLGYSIAFLSVTGLFYSIISKMFYGSTPPGWTSTVFPIFFIGGVQLVMLSVVGAYIGRVYTEVQQRPLYVVKESNLSGDPVNGPSSQT